MSRDIQKSALREKIAQIEKHIEEENNRIKTNRIPARYFMFFLLFGGDTESRSILERKVKELLCNPEACEFLQITERGETLNGEALEQVLREAATNLVEVQTLNNVFLCPVIFANNRLGGDIIPMLTEIDTYMNRSGHMPLWQPTIIIDKDVSEYENIRFCVSEISRFISGMPEGNVNRCCWLSNKDENNFAVPMEQIMQTVAAVAVLQNAVTKTGNSANSISQKVSRTFGADEKEHLFFTARNVAVTNPRRSLLLQRLSVAIDYFSGKEDSTNAMSRINYSFVKDIMRPYLDKLPQHGGRISLLPLFSIMPDRTQFERLQKMVNELYATPLCGDEVRNNQLQAAKQRFLECYFAANGSLKELKKLISEKSLEKEFLQHQQDCYGEIPMEWPFVDGRKLSAFANSQSSEAARYCKELIEKCGWTLLESVGNELSKPEMIHTITNVQDAIAEIQDCIKFRMNQLRAVETVLIVDRTENRTNFNEIQAGWLETVAMNDPQRYGKLNKQFDKKIYELLQAGDADCETLLDICYEAIQNTALSNKEYLEQVSRECELSEGRALEFIDVVKKRWCYTLRFLRRDEAKDATCVIGDERNQFCRSLQDKFGGTLFDFSGFDRIDILHISGAFSPEHILEWSQIEASGKEAECV